MNLMYYCILTVHVSRTEVHINILKVFYQVASVFVVYSLHFVMKYRAIEKALTSSLIVLNQN